MKNKRIFLILSIFLFLIGIFIFIYFYSFLNKVKIIELPHSDEELGIRDDIIEVEKEKRKGVRNIALFGLDSRSDIDNTGSRSDSIIIFTIDWVNNKVKLTSIMRDTYVNVAGYGMTKITHAYAYGGAALGVKTINENFGLNIRDYATVDFFALEKIIDELGGIEINIKEREINSKITKGPLINDYINEVSFIEKVPIKKITKPGIQLLNGLQAVAYARIRYSGNGDYERTDRQRKVLEEILKKAKNSGITKYPKLINTILPYVSTSISKGDILKIGTSILTSDINIEELRIPQDGFCQGKMINGVYYLVADIKEARNSIYEFIYEEEILNK